MTGPGVFPAGTYAVHQCLPAGDYEGAGSSQTTFIIGSDVANSPYTCQAVWETDQPLRIAGIHIVGNGIGAAYGYGGIVQSFGTYVNLSDVIVENVTASYWFETFDGYLTADHVTAYSRTGNCPCVYGQGGDSAYVFAAVRSAPSIATGNDVTVTNSEIHADFIKGAIAIFGSGQLYSAGNKLINCGADSSVAFNTGAYCILGYAVGTSEPNAVISFNDTITGAKSAGIYAARAGYVRVYGTAFVNSGNDPNGDTTPKGAIATNCVTAVSIENVTFQNVQHYIVSDINSAYCPYGSVIVQ